MENLYYDLDCPILNVNQRMGWTSYIDFITWKEVTHPIMKGIDICRRKFIVIKMVVNQVRIMQTFFQRYTGGEGWMGCGHATTNLIDTSGGMTAEQIEFIKKITNEESPILVEDLRPYLETFINHPVELYDERREEAAKTIQKAWKLCRYDPNFVMCHRVQNRNLDYILANK